MSTARNIALHPRIRVSTLERDLRSCYTIDTLRLLQRHAPHLNFTLMMGADNFLQLNAWKDWTEIMALAPVAVFGRPGYHLRAASSMAATRYLSRRVGEDDCQRLPFTKPPAWTLIFNRLFDISSSTLRAERAPPGN